MSISFRLRPATLFVAGALLVPCAAFAQDVPPAITPATYSPTAPVPAPVASPATAPTTVQPVLSMTFNDVEVTELLSMISTQFELPIAISGDVTGTLRSINLKDKTAEQALAVVVQAAQLSVQKTGDGTYIISKAAPAPLPVADPIIPQNTPPIQPVQGFGGNNGLSNNTALRQFGSPDTGTSSFEAQEELRLVPTGNSTDSKEREYRVPIRNVKASLLAYWIDPANQPVPVDITVAKHNENGYINRPLVTAQIGGSQLSAPGFSNQGNGVVPNSSSGNPWLNSNAEMLQSQTMSNAQFGRGNNGGNFGGNNGNFGGNNGNFGGNNGGRNGVGGRNGGGTFQLPEGVSRIVAVDPQNALLVFGTPEGAARLANTIRFLDRPLRQVEIEAQFLSVSTTDAKTYGFDFTTSRGNFNASSTGTTSRADGGLNVGFFRGNFEASISAAITSGKAKVLTAPRVTAINNLTAFLQQDLSTPVTITTTNTVANNAIAQNTSQQVFYVTTSIGLQVTPTINNDDTVTVLMQPFFQSQGQPNALGAAPVTSQSLQTIANVRDGETIALGGLRTTNVSIDKTRVPLLGDIPFIGSIFRSRNNRSTEAELIIFLTARILRRVGDDDAVGATDIPVGIG